jgi:aspyridone synthetase trans-acting enoyl reductase
MTSFKQTQKALKITAPGQFTVLDTAPVPQPEADEVLIQVAAVALNPFDAKSADLSPTVGATAGCDYAGTVIAIGSDASKHITVGDRVCGCVFGNNPDRTENGAFAEIVAAPTDLVLKIPEGVSFEQAATLGVGLSTAGMALYNSFRLPMPISSDGDGRCVLVNGGATATGTLAIQLLRLSGCSPVVTCSPQSFAMVRQLGAVATFDYRSPTCGSDIRDATGDNLQFALDCVTSTASMKLCYEALSSKGGRYLSLDPFPLRAHNRRSVKPETIVCLTQFGKAMSKPYKRPARPQDREFARGWLERAEKLLAEGRIQPHPHQEMPGGLEGLGDGISLVRQGKVAGCKLVYALPVGSP